MSRFLPVTHTIFDLDGLILDTETLNTEIYTEIARRFGIKDIPTNVRQMMLGRDEKDGAEIFVKEMGVSISVSEVRKIRKTKAREMAESIETLPGAERIICHFKKHNVPMGLATSSHYESICLKLSSHKGLLESFSHVVSGIDDPEVKTGKPAPDIFLVTASRFTDKPNPGKCLVFEDSPSGVTGAIDAGMQVVMVPDPQSLLNPEVTKQATLILKSLCDFKPECFSLPPFPC